MEEVEKLAGSYAGALILEFRPVLLSSEGERLEEEGSGSWICWWELAPHPC